MQDFTNSSLKGQLKKAIWFWIAQHLQISFESKNCELKFKYAYKIIQVINCLIFITGASITACRGTGCHIVALEEDEEIFEALLLPMQKPTPTVVAVEVNDPPTEVPKSQDPNAMNVVPRKFIQRDRPRK
jgi:hypothetical protein